MNRAGLFRLLRRRTARNAASLDRRVESRCLQSAAVLVADCSSFTRRTHEQGVLHFLAVMLRVFDRLSPIVRRHRGRRVEVAADNMLAVFGDGRAAVRAAVAMQKAARAYNRSAPASDRLSLCIGIHHGPVLRLSDDVFGPAVNIASKLGEDLAGADEILVTRPVADLAPEARPKYLRTVELGGRLFELFKVRR